MKTLIKTFSIVIALVIIGCKDSTSNSNINADQEEDHLIVVTKDQFSQNKMVLGNVTEKSFPIGIKVNGMVDVPPENKAIINSIKGGYIKTIPLLVGDNVKKGDVLVTIENPEFVNMQQEYLEVKEQLNYLKNEYDRQNIMFKENIISEKVFLKAQSQYKRAVAKYNGLRKQLVMLNINPANAEQGKLTSVANIYAPIAGSITHVNVSKGSYVSPSTPILEIIDNSHIHLELSVFEKDIMNIKKNQKILFSIPESSNKTFEASVYLVGTSIEENRTIKVHAHPNDETHNFLTGMFVDAQIIIDEIKSIALPESTVIEEDNKYFVLQLDKEDSEHYYFNKLEVAIGTTYDSFIQIKNVNLFTENKKLLLEGAFSLIGI